MRDLSVATPAPVLSRRSRRHLRHLLRRSREVTVDCPVSCEYLQEAHRHEPRAQFDASKMGHPEVRLTEEFVESRVTLMFGVSFALTLASTQVGAVDSDVREALASLIQTYRTRQSGVIYEALPANPLAANLHRRVQKTLGDFRQQEKKELGLTKTRDDDVLRMLVFFERLALDRNNEQAALPGLP